MTLVNLLPHRQRRRQERRRGFYVGLGASTALGLALVLGNWGRARARVRLSSREREPFSENAHLCSVRRLLSLSWKTGEAPHPRAPLFLPAHTPCPPPSPRTRPSAPAWRRCEYECLCVCEREECVRLAHSPPQPVPPIHPPSPQSYNRPSADFPDRAAYDDYLEEKEDIS